MPRGIFGMRLVLVVKGSAESWFMRHSPLNAALVRDWHRRLKSSVFIGFVS